MTNETCCSTCTCRKHSDYFAPHNKTKQLGDHILDCFGVSNADEGRWGSPWGVPEGLKWLDKRGGNRGSTTAWLKVGCNDPSCSAAILIEWFPILDAL